MVAVIFDVYGIAMASFVTSVPLRVSPRRQLTNVQHLTRAVSAPPTPPPIQGPPSSSSFSSPPPPPPPPPHIDNEMELQAAIACSSAELTVLKVYSRRCRSCKRIERGYARLAAKYSSSVSCLQLCSEKNEDMARGLGVRGFPTFIFYQDGNRVDHFASSSAEVLEDAINDYI